MTKRTSVACVLLFLFAFSFGLSFALASSAQAQPDECCPFAFCDYTGQWVYGHNPLHSSECVNDGTDPCDFVYLCPQP